MVDLVQEITEVHVGKKLRELRGERKLSIRALAEKSGLAINTLSLIENEKTSPSVSTLQQLANALQVPITTFFEMETETRHVVFTAREQRPEGFQAMQGISLEDLGAGLADRAVQPIIVRLEPEAESGPDPIIHTGHEFVYCLDGRIRYTIEDQDYFLEPGDSLVFESHLPHCWANPSTTTAEIILVLIPADNRDHPVSRHFHQE